MQKWNLSKWDVSNVTLMNDMFAYLGTKSDYYNLGDLSNWNVSKVTDTSCMFWGAGQEASEKQ